MFDAPVDVERLTKPEADAFRYIAEALGARFAGDVTADNLTQIAHAMDAQAAPATGPAARVQSSHDAAPRRVTAGSFNSTAPKDTQLARALDAVPLSLLVADGDAVLYINRAALAHFGHSSADVINAGGGLGALFDRRAKRRGALVPMLSASGEESLAKVTLSAISWAGGRAVLISIDHQAAALDTAEAAARMFRSDGVTAAALRAVLDVCPHPAAIINAEGDALATNGSYAALEETLAGMGITPLISQTALQGVTHRALGTVDGTVQRADRVLLGQSVYTARAMALGPLPACALTLVPASEHAERELSALANMAARSMAALRPPMPSNDPISPQRSMVEVVHNVRTTVSDLAVLFVGEGDSQGAKVPAPVGDALERLAEALARQSRGRSVVTVRQHGTAIRITGAGAVAQPLDESLAISLADGRTSAAVQVVRHGAGDISIAPLGA